MLATDTPLQGHPALALGVFGAALILTGGRALAGVALTVLTDRRGARCGQAH